MKLRKLHIEDYKMFKDFDISFVDDNDEALPIIVLAGVNGSGKTTLLECLAIEREKYTLKINEKEEANFDFAMDFSWLKRYDEIIYLPLVYKNYETNIKIFDNLEDYILREYINIAKELDSFKEALSSLQQYIDDIFKDLDLSFNIFDVDYNLKRVIFSNKNNEPFSIDELSSGEKTLLSKILYLYFNKYKNKLILIDEPELSLHPSWQNKVLKIYENFALKNNCQIIIATHSPHIIGSAKNEYLRILRKNEEGNVEVVSGLKAHGRDINSILFDVMGEVAYRPREFDDKIDRLHIAIDDRKIEEAQKRLEELKKDYGEDDEVIMEAQMLINMFRRDDKVL